ncbi:MAG: 2-oxo acid dehydrogenase subunit E2 [Alphaproteobacteria bacterium]
MARPPPHGARAAQGPGGKGHRPVAASAIALRRVVTATLAADHRVSDGHRGARFLERVGHLLQEPEKL